VTVARGHELVADEKQMDNGSHQPVNKVIHDAFKTMEGELRRVGENTSRRVDVRICRAADLPERRGKQKLPLVLDGIARVQSHVRSPRIIEVMRADSVVASGGAIMAKIIENAIGIAHLLQQNVVP
jgi:hypothetical protein